MRILTTLLLGFVLGNPLFAQTPQSDNEEAAVRDIIARYTAARDRRDPEAIRSLFTEDADQYTTSGEWRRGRESVVTGTAASSERNPGARRISAQAVRFVTPGVAIVDGAYEIGAPALARAPATPGEGSARRVWTTLVVTRGSEGWRIAAIRNAAPR